MQQKHIDMVKSGIRHFAITAAGVYAAGVHDWSAVLVGALAAIIGPAIRGIDKNDPAFGLIANLTEAELKKIVKKLSK
jgi:hypothetical protein